ncbi:MAG: DUF935 domain-containing protein [Sphingobacteriaceae bacterium]|nr:DUF935 domain-containing protein [Sphingobacteriaceae bacterium]
MATKTTPEYIINDLTLVSPNRQRKDIQTLKNDVITAESIYYPNRTGLYDLYHDIYTMDGFLNGIVTKRINNVLNKTLKFIDPSGKVNEDITKLITSAPGRNLITQILESKFWGISGVEFVIGKTFQFEIIPRKHIKPEKGLITRSQYGVAQDNGFPYEDMPFVWVIGDKHDLGLFLPCSMYAIYKRGNFGDWAQYVEIFGQPVRIIYYDAYDTQTKNELKQLLDNSGSSLAMMVPKQAEFSMLDGKTSNGTGELQGTFKDACNNEMAICILGNTETTTSSKSSGYAQSKEHGKQQDEITKADLAFVSNLLNSEKFLAILQSYGYNVAGGTFKYELELDLTGLKLRMEIDTFVSTKVPIGDDYYYQTYGIPKPENYDQLKAEMIEKSKQEAESKSEPKTNAEQKKLIETKKQNLADKILKNIADFFDPAQH